MVMLDWLFNDMLTFFPENVGSTGKELDGMFAFIYYVSVLIFLLTYGLLITFIIKYRYNPNRRAYHFHGNNLVEFTWTILPTFLFVGIGLWSEDSWARTKYAARVPSPDVHVEVIGYQFGWQVRYPGADGLLGRKDRFQMTAANPFGIDSTDPAGKDDIILMNQLHVPINKNILVDLSSIDVLHSFFLPNLRIKQDAVPGMWIKVWFNGMKAGKYEIACAELCGFGHYGMRGELFMYSQEDFDKWLDEQYKSKQPVAAVTETATPKLVAAR